VIDRRDFLRRLAGAAAAIAVAPSIASALEQLTGPTTVSTGLTVSAGGTAIMADPWPLGLIDCISSSPLHGLSSSTVAQWAT
jgi:hypothetical protein